MHDLSLALRCLFVSGLLLLLHTAPLNAGRPLVIDDAPPVAAGHLDVELGITYGRPRGGGREQAWPVVTMAYGLFERLEAGFSIQRINHDQRGEPPLRGFEDLHLGAKLSLIGESQTFPAASLALDVKVPTASKSKGLSTGKSDQGFTLIFSKHLAPIELDLNVGYLRAGSVKNEKLKNVISGGIAATYGLRPEVVLVGEIFGASRSDHDSPNLAAFQLGLRYAVTPQIVLDAAAGRSLRPTGSNFQFTAGLTWTYDLATFLKRGIK